MSETGRAGDIKAQPRAQGALRIACKSRDGETVLSTLFQKGSLKTLFPRTPGNHLDAVLLNTAGGITGGDVFECALNVGQGASLRMTTQAAERVYKAQGLQAGTVTTNVQIKGGASLHWLPQETIIFDEARLNRSLTVELSGTAEFLCVEPMVFGRAAMGETVRKARISDQWRVRRDGVLVFADAMKIDGDVDDILSRAAITAGRIATAAILMVSPRAEAKIEPLRQSIGQSGGASLIQNGVLFARLLAPDSFTLRKSLIPAIEALSDTHIPKTWRL